MDTGVLTDRNIFAFWFLFFLVCSVVVVSVFFFFFFQAEDGIRDLTVTGVQTCALPICWHGDTSRMYFVGTPSVMARRLVETTYEAMWRGIRAVRPGATLGDIGHAIQIGRASCRERV